MWPIIFHLRYFTFSRNGFILALSNSYLVLTWSCHLMRRIFRRHLLWNTSIALSSPLFIFHVSHPYNNTGTTSVLYSLNFVFLEMLLERHMFFNPMNAPLALVHLFFRSFMPPPSLHTFAPNKCVNSSTSSISISLTTIWSWFLALILVVFVFFVLTLSPTPLASSSSFVVLSWICCLVEEIIAVSSAKSKSPSLDVNLHLIHHSHHFQLFFSLPNQLWSIVSPSIEYCSSRGKEDVTLSGIPWARQEKLQKRLKKMFHGFNVKATFTKRRRTTIS